MSPSQRVDRILAESVGSDLNSWEKFEFLPSIKSRHVLTEKQEAKLSEIELKIFGEEE